MFRSLKKPDASETTKQCLEVFYVLTDHDRLSSSKNILIYAKYLSDNCNTGAEALLKLAKLKQKAIQEHNLRDHNHPAFMQVQILSDYIYTHKQDQAQHLNTAYALRLITSSLNGYDQAALEKYLARLTEDSISNGPLNNLHRNPEPKSGTSKIVRECPRCSQRCRVTNQSVEGKLIEITCPTCTLRWTTFS